MARATTAPRLSRDAVTPGPVAADAPLGTFALAVTLLTLGAVAATLLPGMWAWGLAGARFVPMPWRALWLLPVLALLPPVSRPLVRVAGVLGDALGGRLGGWLAFGLGALTVLALPDHTWFTGDFLQRLSGIELHAPSANYVGAMPIDWLLHSALPRLLLADPGQHALGWLRALGVIECGLLAVVARAWVRSLGLAGAETAAGVLLVVGTGALTVFTGLGKPAALLCVITLGVLVAGVRTARGEGGALALGGCVAFALLLHRSAVLLVPAWAVATALAVAHERRAVSPRWFRLMPLALPLVVIVAAWPRLVSALLLYDLPHHLTPGGSVTGQTVEGGWLALVHLADIVNAILLFAPALVLMLPVLALTGPPAWREAGERFRLTLVAAAALVLLLVFPQQGIFRDLDVFAPWTVLLEAVAIGTLASRLPAGERRAAWLTRAGLVSAALSLAVVTAFADPTAGLERVRAYLIGPPLRDAATRSLGWDFLIGPYIRLQRLDDAVDCLDRAIALAPHRRLFLTLALVEGGRQRPDRVEAAYGEIARRWPDDALGWFGLAGARQALGDATGRDSALARVVALTRGEARRRGEVARYRASFPQVWPGPPALADSALAPR